MDETSPLLGEPPQENAELLTPNLRPRHQDLIPTPCGPIKRWSELSWPVKIYFGFTITSLLALLALTSLNIHEQRMKNATLKEDNEDNLTVSLVQLVGILFCGYYIFRGVLQENRQELVVFMLSVMVLIIRSVVNFVVLESEGRKEVLVLVRFVCIVVLGFVHVLCASLLIWRHNMMAFRVGGALDSLQKQYCLLTLCFSMVMFDLQAQVCLCILIITSDSARFATNITILGVGVFWACATAAVGAVAVLKEVSVLVWIFMLQNLPQLVYFIYLLYTVVKNWSSNDSHTEEAAAITGALISLLIKVVLFWGLIRLVRSFGQGLRERMFASSS
ncbi:uncharacterized protein KZ484_016506 isoform 2-T2 [Pholidichthys leucotaenia]